MRERGGGVGWGGGALKNSERQFDAGISEMLSTTQHHIPQIACASGVGWGGGGGGIEKLRKAI